MLKSSVKFKKILTVKCFCSVVVFISFAGHGVLTNLGFII